MKPSQPAWMQAALAEQATTVGSNASTVGVAYSSEQVPVTRVSVAAGPQVAVDEQPSPTHRPDLPDVWLLVMQDMQARAEAGYHRYGTRLRPFNGRVPLVDAYQEALDLAVYLRQAIWEQEHEPA